MLDRLSFNEKDLPSFNVLRARFQQEKAIQSKIRHQAKVEEAFNYMDKVAPWLRDHYQQELSLFQLGYDKMIVGSRNRGVSIGRVDQQKEIPDIALRDTHVSRGKSILFQYDNVKNLWIVTNNGRYPFLKGSEQLAPQQSSEMKDNEVLQIGLVTIKVRVTKDTLIVGAQEPYSITGSPVL